MGSTGAAGVGAFNALAEAEAAERLAGCLRAPGWVAQVLARRPYPDRRALLATAYELGTGLDEADLLAALAAHPRIGERPAGPGAEAAHSRAEQSGVDPADAEVALRLREGNVAYEKKFGQVFLIRAAGRSGPQILAALNERLEHDAAQEAVVVREQLAQIAGLRLTAFLDELEAGR
jgi:2-oxo-4-hydroxy-4-carboxy-5-ureidoimidazoline decarboxylase